MDALDVAIIIVLVAAAVHGARVGGLAQIAEFLGAVAGFALGSVLVLVICPRVSGTLTKPLLAVTLLILPVAVISMGGRELGVRLSTSLHRFRIWILDEVVGALTAMASALVVLWLFGSILVSSPLATVSNEIEYSYLLRGVGEVMPPIPDVFSGVERYLATTGFPQVLANIVPQPYVPVRLATEPQVVAVSHEVAGSVLKVVAIGCGGERDGSGFVVQDDLVITNAHVVAGSNVIEAVATNGRASRLVPIWFDSRFDLAVLRIVHPLGISPLPVFPGFITRGTRAVIFGYPGGGPLVAQPAGVISLFAAEGRDIYDQSLTVRNVYEVAGIVLPGNSGGPLVAQVNGIDEVVGVVFSRSTSNSDVGFALATPGVVQRIEEALPVERPTHTGSCIT
ncbi:MAG TPA: MarP family serine protease [Acidimicrobiales bacterium]|nr:MarP family serine protease [Acidimicrobiales bacterium]